LGEITSVSQDDELALSHGVEHVGRRAPDGRKALHGSGSRTANGGGDLEPILVPEGIAHSARTLPAEAAAKPTGLAHA